MQDAIPAEIIAIPVQITMVSPANTGFHRRIKLNRIPKMAKNKIHPQFFIPYCLRSNAKERYWMDLNMAKKPITKGKVAKEIAGLLNSNNPNRVFKIPPVRYQPQPSISFLLLNEKIISATPENRNEILKTNDNARKEVTGVDKT